MVKVKFFIKIFVMGEINGFYEHDHFRMRYGTLQKKSFIMYYFVTGNGERVFLWHYILVSDESLIPYFSYFCFLYMSSVCMTSVVLK